jgi:hypothetical protein
MPPAAPDLATLLKGLQATQERQAALLAGALAAQTALIALLVECGIAAPAEVAVHFAAARSQIAPQHAAVGAAEAIDSVLRYLADAYAEVPPSPRSGPALAVIAGGLSDPPA